jgi:Zn-dependent M28 family amino/carboxypeptidase
MLLAPSAAPPVPDLPEGTEGAEAAITEDGLRATVRFLAGDLLEGRGPATRGDALARAWIASQLEGMGYRPGAPGGQWEQPLEMVGVTASAQPVWHFSAKGGGKELRVLDDFVAFPGRPEEQTALRDAELVFVGFGIEAPEYGWDDYKGADLRGKVLVMLNDEPDADPALFAGKRRLYYGRWDYKLESAARQGASGAILIHTRASAGYGWNVVRTSWTGEQFELPGTAGPRLQVGSWISEEAARALARLGGHDLDALRAAAGRRDFRPVPLGITTSYALRNAVRRVTTANVAGLLPGSDPRLKDEVVVFTAHHDHLGIGAADANGDRIYNGAVDNAAGVAQMLAVARAFSALPAPPRRSVLVLAVAAEEFGLLGSGWFARHPTFPAGRIAANVNFDGGNIWGKTTEIPLIGFGKSSLDDFARKAASRQGRAVTDEPFPDRGFFYRSDQFSFARIGVPALYFDTATTFVGRPPEWGKERIEAYEGERYHQPGDELTAEWVFDGMVEDARFAFVTGLLVAQADAMPAWTPGDEFEEVRKHALETAAKR